MMNAAGYKENVLEKIQKFYANKLESVKQELLSLKEETQHIDSV